MWCFIEKTATVTGVPQAWLRTGRWLGRWCVFGLAHIYPLKLLHIVQVGLLTNAQIEELLPLGAHRIPLGLETRVHVDREDGPAQMLLVCVLLHDINLRSQ